MGGYELGDFDGIKRPAKTKLWPTGTWLSNKTSDMNKTINLADQEPAMLAQLRDALKRKLIECVAPSEQLTRLGLN